MAKFIMPWLILIVVVQYVARTEGPKCNETNTNANTVEILRKTYTHTHICMQELSPNEFAEKFKLNEVVGWQVKRIFYAILIETEQESYARIQ